MRFLERVDAKSQKALLSLSRLVELSNGQHLVRRGQRGDELFLLEAGTLEVVDARSTPEVILSTLGPGTLVGEFGFMGEEEQRTADVRAAGQARCRVWDGGALKRELASQPWLAGEFYRALAELLAERARSMSQMVFAERLSGEAIGGENAQLEAHELVAPARAAWLNAERKLRDAPQDRDAIREMRRAVENLMRRSCRWIRGKGNPESERAAGEALYRELGPFLARSQTGALVLEGSEARRLAHTLLNQPKGQGPLGQTFDRVLLSLPSAIAMRRRTNLAGQTLLANLPERAVSVLFVGVGSGALISRLMPSLGEHGATLTCMDADRDALSALDIGQTVRAPSVQLRLMQTNLAALSMNQTTVRTPSQDLIVLDGLLDFLPDRLVAGIMTWCRDQLVVGGRVMVTAMAPWKDAPIFDHLIDWPMIRRPARGLRALVEAVGLRAAVIAGGQGSQDPAVVISATRPNAGE
ncbi:MAG: cyclic nucleotide-binding domain-containing protein [Myxococcota bacterium]